MFDQNDPTCVLIRNMFVEDPSGLNTELFQAKQQPAERLK
jgi:hypothetical protein